VYHYLCGTWPKRASRKVEENCLSDDNDDRKYFLDPAGIISNIQDTSKLGKALI
jgi:hypothetical protein